MSEKQKKKVPRQQSDHSDSQRGTLSQFDEEKQLMIENALSSYDNSQDSCRCQCHAKYSHEQNRQIQSLRLKQHLLDSQYSFNLQMVKNQLDEAKYKNECLQMQNTKLRQFVLNTTNQCDNLRGTLSKYQAQLSNQQLLIDQYKISMQEQIQLEKQVVKAGYQQRQCQLRNQFQKALKDIQSNYGRRTKQTEYQQAKKSLNLQIKKIKKFCGLLRCGQYSQQRENKDIQKQHVFLRSNKSNMLRCTGEHKTALGSSTYSTVDR